MKKLQAYGVFLIFSLLNLIQPAKADDSMWWETIIGYGGAVANSGTDIRSIPMYARIRDLTFSVPKSNADVLIVGLRFDQKFDEKPFEQNKYLNSGIRLANTNQKSPNCIYNNKCDQVLYFNSPSLWNGEYPSTPGFNTVNIYKIPQNLENENGKLENTNCPAPWWIERNPASYDSIKFQLSITCLGIEQNFTAYGFAGADIGITPIPYNFTSVASANNPYWQLAKVAYQNNGEESGVTKPFISPPKVKTKYLSCIKGKKTKLIKLPGKCPNGYVKQKTVTKLEEV